LLSCALLMASPVTLTYWVFTFKGFKTASGLTSVALQQAKSIWALWAATWEETIFKTCIMLWYIAVLPTPTPLLLAL